MKIPLINIKVTGLPPLLNKEQWGLERNTKKWSQDFKVQNNQRIKSRIELESVLKSLNSCISCSTQGINVLCYLQDGLSHELVHNDCLFLQ